MKKLVLFFAAVALCLHVAYGASSVEAARALADRVVPQIAQQLVFVEAPDSVDTYAISATPDGKVMIAGNNANSMAAGLNHYLKYLCNVEIGWFKHDRYTVPDSLVLPAEPIVRRARVGNRFFLNYCTFGYTMPWWDWAQWEHFIDWMALNGINLPLAITGQESIWHKVWTQLGLTDQEVRAYFTGPAHLPWHRMLNIDRWQGPLPQSWLDGQQALQQKITARERELNMHPVLPAFAGHVPAELQRVYPEAKITQLKPWAGFPAEDACSFLDPMDPLFGRIQLALFLEKQRELYGTDHVYGIDLFNEVTPPSWEPEYLQRVSRQVYDALAAVDPEGVWLQMTWLFYNDSKHWTNDRVEPYVTAMPRDKSLLLDYYCERREVWRQTDKYFGMPYIWCYLGNFGGNTMLAGNLHTINERVEGTFAEGGEGFSGIGSTIEGLDCNPFVYEYVFEKAWDDPLHNDVERWAERLADRRTGKVDPKARHAWQTLVDSVYNSHATFGQASLINTRPTFGKYKTWYSKPRYQYDNHTLLAIVNELLEVDSDEPAYQYDLVNLTRQLISNYFLTAFYDYEQAYQRRDTAKMQQRRTEMQTLLADIERLLATQSAFLVGKWIADARAMGATDQEKDYYESNARCLLTTWGDAAMGLNDYASRTWNGLVGDFYARRWEMFFDHVEAAMAAGIPFGDTSDDPAYTAFRDEVTAFEKDWWENRRGEYPAQPSGNSKQAVRELVEKYAPAILAQPNLRDNPHN